MSNQISLLDEMYIDGFCGGGGWSTGFEFAIGKPVDIGINHDKSAIDMHKKNHPYTKHYNESIYEVDPYKAVAGRKVGWAHFSPDCTHFSVAKGGKPVKKSIRGLAWVITKWAGTVKPRIISMENVREFQTWCPLVAKRGKHGRVLKPNDKYNRFMEKYTDDEIDDLGLTIPPCYIEAEKGEVVPLSKQQLMPDKKRKGETFHKFIRVMENLGYKAEWRILKACDYGAPTSRQRLFIIFRCDGEPIMWPEPTHGDPNSEEVKLGKLLPYRTAAECIEWGRPIQSIFERKRPLAKNTMKRIARGIKKFIIDNPEPFFIMCNNENNVGSGATEPLHTVTTANRHYLTAPVITSIGQTGTENRSSSIEEPLRTVVTKQEHCLATASMIQYHSETTKNEVRGQELTEPIQTIDTANRHGLSVAFVEKAYGGNYQGAGTSMNEPLDTITAIDHNRLVAPFLSKYYSGEGEKGNSVIDPLATITAKERFGCVAATMIQTGYGERLGQEPRALDLNKPLGTVVSTPKHAAVTASFISRQFGTSTGHKVDEPLGTITQTDKSKLVEVFLEQHDIDPDIVIGGEHYRIVDICMRMLAPRELYNAQGFPPDYEIEFDVNGKPYPKTQQVAKVGNSVPPQFATALVRANMPDKCVWHIETMEDLNEKIAI